MTPKTQTKKMKMRIGKTVMIEARIERLDDNYAEVRIADGICGMNTVRVTVHRAAIVGANHYG